MFKQETAQLILNRCMGYKAGETVLVVTDEPMEELGWQVYKAIRELDIEAIIVSMKARGMHGEEPPDCIREALCKMDIALLITTKSLSHTEARRSASQSSRKTRIASMPGVDPRRIDRLLNVDYDEMIRHSLALAEALKNCSEVGITTKSGTNLKMVIQDRVPQLDTGILVAPGSFGNLPAGEVYLAPLEGTAQGTIVIDGSMAGIGRLKRPIKITVKNGFATDIDSEPLRNLLKSMPLRQVAGEATYDRSAYNIAELGIGINPNAEVLGNILEDEKAIGTVHIALGDNISLGGKVKAPCHLDGIIMEPTIKLNGKVIPKKLLNWYPDQKPSHKKPKPTETAMPRRQVAEEATYAIETFKEIRSLIGPEMYKSLFEHSNDPQYLVDRKSQVFLEANPAFLTMCGYTREEMVGRLKAKDITAPNYQPMLIKKTDAYEQGIKRERYEFGILSKSGQIKTVEVSVHRFKLGDREVSWGSVRDISERLALEKALRERITEIALGGNRLMVLTERIKSVPIITSSLLNSQSEDELCERAIRMFCDPQGLRYKDAAIYFIQSRWGGTYLQLAKSGAGTSHSDKLKKAPRRINLYKSHRLAMIARGDAAPLREGSEIILPLKGHGQTLGLAWVILDPKEKELMDANPTAKKGYQDVLETIISTLGLLIESQRLNKALEVQSVQDELTKVYNRRYFERVIKEETQRARRYRRKLALILVDLDNFKEINDVYGHKQGDLILSELAHLLKRHSRESDSVCRYGGDEFIIILPETSLAGALVKAKLIHQKVAEHRFTNPNQTQKPFRIKASFGVTAFSTRAQITSEEALIAVADKALYQAKQAPGEHIVSLGEPD